ncbi:MAG: hypothetical protein ABW217_18125 [Polyangiaceae bacterium]
MLRVGWAGVVPLWTALACGGTVHSDRHQDGPDGEPAANGGTGGSVDTPSEEPPAAAALDDEPLQMVPEIAITEPKLYACLDSRDVSARDRNPDGTRIVELATAGIIEEVGAGPPAGTAGGACPFVSLGDFGGSFSLEDLDLLAQQTWIRIREPSGEIITLSIIASGFRFNDRVGEVVDLRYLATPAGFSPTQSWLELRRAGGALILWLSHSGRVEDLAGASDIERSVGAVDGEGSSECVTSWDRRRVNITLDGIHTSVGYRQQAAVGSWRVTNGGVVIQTGESRCADAYALSASLAIWNETDAVPYTSGIGGWCDAALTAEVGNYYDDKSFVCLEGEGSRGYLSMSCESDEGCLPGSVCSVGFCRATE